MPAPLALSEPSSLRPLQIRPSRRGKVARSRRTLARLTTAEPCRRRPAPGPLPMRPGATREPLQDNQTARRVPAGGRTVATFPTC